MGVRKIGEEHIRTIQQNTTGSLLISLPALNVRDLKWRKGQKLVVKQQGKKLIIEDWQG